MSADTTPEAEQVLFELLAQKSPAEKLRMVAKINAAVRMLALNGLQENNPNDTELQLKLKLAELLYGAEAAAGIAARHEAALPNE